MKYGVINSSYIEIKAILLSTIVGLLNSFFYDNVTIMTTLCVVEVAVLFFCIIKKKYIKYIAYYTVFLCFSMESEAFVGSSIFYGFKNFRLVGLNLAVWTLLPMIAFSIIKYKYLFSNMGYVHKKVLSKLIFFTLIGTIVSLAVFLVNDNGFANKAGSASVLIDSFYTYFLPCLELLAVSFCIIAQRDKLEILKKYLYSIIVGTAIVFLACLVLKNYGNRGGLNSLQVSTVYFLLVMTIVLLVYEDFNPRSKVLLGISGTVIIILSLAYNASGKIVITTVLIPIIMVTILAKKGSALKTIVMVMIGVFVLLFLGFYLMPLLMKNSMLLTTKYEQAMKLFAFNSDNWFENIPSSPKMRITEFMNIAEEYFRKPWYAVFGKGFCGTIQDHLGLFDDLSEFAFSRWELELGAYYSMHESINCFFLTGGICGLSILVSIVIRLFKNIDKSPWLIFGVVWLLMFYNYHMTVGIYGIVCLVVGLQDICIADRDKQHLGKYKGGM